MMSNASHLATQSKSYLTLDHRLQLQLKPALVTATVTTLHRRRFLNSMALSSLSPLPRFLATPSTTLPKLLHSAAPNLSFPATRNADGFSTTTTTTNFPPDYSKWRTHVSFFPDLFTNKTKTAESVKQELLEAIAPLDRGGEATVDDQQTVDQIARKLEALNPTKEPLKSSFLNGKWELIYTTSKSILQTQRPKFLRSRTNYQAINADTLRAQNMESWPFFNQVTADLTPLNARKVAVKFDYFKIGGLIPVKAPGRARGELEITYLDEELRVSRGDLGNLFILKMVDPSYRIPS